MDYRLISLYIATLFFLCLLLLVVIKGVRSIGKTVYSFHLLNVTLWTFGLAMFYQTKSLKVALFWTDVLYTAGGLIAATFLHFSYTFPTGTINLHRDKQFLIYLPNIILFFLFFFTPLIIRNVAFYNTEKVFIYGPCHILWDLQFDIAFFMAFCRLFRIYRYSKGIEKMRLKYIVLGTFLATLLAGITNVIMPWFRCDFIWLGPCFSLIAVACIVYAITRYRLMDANIAVRKIIANLVLIMFISCIVIFLYISSIDQMLKFAGAFIIAILLTLYIPSLKHRLEGLINRILFGTKYNYQETLVEISNAIPTIIDLYELLKYIADEVCKAMGIAKGAVLIKDNFSNKYSIQYQHGFDGEKTSSMNVEAQGPLVSRIKNVEDVLVRHEMIQILNEKDYNNLCTDLDKFDAEVVVPIRKGGNVLGLLTLSDKAGGDTFGQEDFRLLHIIAIQAAVAIENIRLYNKLIHTDRQTFLETLASGVSHEMRNRLVAIRTFIDLFPERVQKEHVEQGYYEFRDLAAREMERLTKIIDGLLSYSRAVGKGGEELNINALIEESILIIDSKLKDKDIKLIKNLGKNVTSIKGDKGRLLQVFINIMQNGIEAMNKGGQLTITTIEKDNEIEADISDTGKGIDKEHLDAIFEPFFTTKHDGTGLGLSIVQRIVRDHNGNIKVESELGKGTTFFVSFQKGIEYKPEEIKAKEKLGYWEVKKESEKTESSH